MKIAVLSSHTPSLFWFRIDMMREFLHRGYTVIAIGNEPEELWKDRFADEGIRYCCAYIERNGMNPLHDLKTYRSLRTILKREKPDKLFTYQAKTVIYGGIAAHRLGIGEVYPLIAGMGSVFLKEDLKTRLIRKIVSAEYRMSLKHSSRIFFQNEDDVALFEKFGLIRRERVVMIPGSGVNLEDFRPQPLPAETVFLCISRLIRDKGVGEYLKAAEIVKQKLPKAHFLLVGPYDTNPSAILPEELEAYTKPGIVDYFGEQPDVRPFLAQCSVYVLVSYREGIPKTVLEAMASARAILTTDEPGCRETVRDGENGYFVPVRDPEALAEKMIELISNPETVKRMAEKSLEMVPRFDVKRVNAIICETMKL